MDLENNHYNYENLKIQFGLSVIHSQKCAFSIMIF